MKMVVLSIRVAKGPVFRRMDHFVSHMQPKLRMKLKAMMPHWTEFTLLMPPISVLAVLLSPRLSTGENEGKGSQPAIRGSNVGLKITRETRGNMALMPATEPDCNTGEMELGIHLSIFAVLI